MSASRSRPPASVRSGAALALASPRPHGALRAVAGKLAGFEILALVAVAEIRPLARRRMIPHCAPVPEPACPAPAPSVGRGIPPGLVAGVRERGAPRRFRGALQAPGGVRRSPGAFP